MKSINNHIPKTCLFQVRYLEGPEMHKISSDVCIQSGPAFDNEPREHHVPPDEMFLSPQVLHVTPVQKQIRGPRVDPSCKKIQVDIKPNVRDVTCSPVKRRRIISNMDIIVNETDE